MAKNQPNKVAGNHNRYLEYITKEGGSGWTTDKEKAWQMPESHARFLVDVYCKKYLNFPIDNLKVIDV